MTAKNQMIAGAAIAAVAAVVSGRLMYPGISIFAHDHPLGRTESFLSRLAGPRVEMLNLPAGTHLRVRLKQGISSQRNLAGDLFSASLDEPLMVNGKLLAPAGTRVTGLLTDVTAPEGTQGAGRLTMILRQLQVRGRQYDLVTQPLTLSANSAEKQEPERIGGSSAATALAGAGKSTAAGAGVMRLPAGYLLGAQGEPAVYGPNSRFTFSLADDIDLPVLNQ